MRIRALMTVRTALAARFLLQAECRLVARRPLFLPQIRCSQRPRHFRSAVFAVRLTHSAGLRPRLTDFQPLRRDLVDLFFSPSVGSFDPDRSD